MVPLGLEVHLTHAAVLPVEDDRVLRAVVHRRAVRALELVGANRAITDGVRVPELVGFEEIFGHRDTAAVALAALQGRRRPSCPQFVLRMRRLTVGGSVTAVAVSHPQIAAAPVTTATTDIGHQRARTQPSTSSRTALNAVESRPAGVQERAASRPAT